jgi:uncharacterized protein
MGHPHTSSTGRQAVASIDGRALAQAYAAAAEALAANAAALNAINVFPVPDGDTGTNMSLTMREAIAAIPTGGAGAADVARSAADAALMGARGNSGVILSQVLGGIASGCEGASDVDARRLAACLERACTAACNVVSEPKEGTILTAISAAADAATARAREDATAEDALAAAVEATRDAVARTPDLLPVLKEAGVVDAGAQGLYLVLEAALSSLRGERPPAHAEGLGHIDDGWLAATARAHAAPGAGAGFCTEFVLTSPSVDTERLRDELHEFGDSVLVVGKESLARVHLHTHDPQAAIEHSRAFGDVSREKFDDLAMQVGALAAQQRVAGGPAVIAVVAGAGIERLFGSMGARVVRGGQTMNPSAGDIRRAIEEAGGDAIVLANNKNVVLAAEQAVTGLDQRAAVVPTHSVPQGVAALVAFNSELSWEQNVDAMREAASAVRTAEVTFAARPARIGETDVAEGSPIGIVDGEIVAAGDDVADVARDCVRAMLEGSDEPLVTLYAGEDADPAATQALAATLREEFGAEVEVIDAGQPHYPYVIGVE